MKRRVVLAVVAALWGSGCAIDHLIVQAKPDQPHATKLIEARSGLRFVLEEDHAQPRVAVRMTVVTGSRNDPLGKEGLAHYCEHLFFRSRNDPKFTTFERLDYLGGAKTNAFTFKERTVYETTVPAAALGSTLVVLGEALEHPIQGVDRATLDVERRVVANEFFQSSERRSAGAAVNALDVALFPPEHPYGRVDSLASISKLTFEDAEAFFTAWYQPPNVVITLVGDFSVDQLERQLAERLPEGLLAPRAKPPTDLRPPSFLPDPPPSAGLTTVEGDVESPELYLGITLPGQADPHSTLKPLPMAAFLDIALELDQRKLKQTMRTAEVGQVTDLEGTTVLAHVVLRPGVDPQGAYDQIVDTLFSRSHHERDLISYFMIDLAQKEASPAPKPIDRRADELSMAAFLIKANLPERRAPTTPADLVSRYFSADRVRGVVVVPGAKAQAALKGLVKARAQISQAVVHFPKEQAAQVALTFDPNRIRSFTAPNGFTVTLINDPWATQLNLVGAFPGGTRDLQPRGAYSWVSHTLRRLERGSNARDSGVVEVKEDLTKVHFTTEYAEVGRFVGKVLDKLEDLNVAFLPDTSGRDEMYDDLKLEQSYPRNQAIAGFNAALYRGDPFGQAITVDELKAQPKEATDHWLDRVLTSTGAHLAITGPFDPAKVEPEVRAAVAGWKARTAAEPVGPLNIPEGNGEPVMKVLEVHNTSQVRVLLGCRIEGPGDGRSDASELLGEALEEDFNDKLRMQRGESYGFNAAVNYLRGNASYLLVEGRVDDDQLDDAFKTFFGELDLLRDSLWEDQTIDRARWFVAKDSGGEIVSAPSLADTIATRGARGFDNAWATHLGERLSAVTPSQVDRVWDRCKRTLTLQLSGDAAKIKKSLAASGQKIFK